MKHKSYTAILYSSAVSLFFLSVLLIFPSIASAQVVINELGVLGTSTTDSTDWVEVYNYSPDPIDLSSYKIKDEAGNELNLSGLLGSEEWKDFTWSNRLNNSGDIVWLIEIVVLEEKEVEKIVYGDKGGVCLPPNGDGSIGKTVDGGNVVVMFSKSSKGVSNSLGNMEPCPTPTPEPTSTPTPTPKSTSTPKPTNTPIPTKTPTPKPTKTPTPTFKPLDDDKQEDSEETILGLRDELSPSPTPSNDNDQSKKKFPLAAGFLILAGVGFMGAAGYPLYKDKLKIYNLSNVFKRGKRRRSIEVNPSEQGEAD